MTEIEKQKIYNLMICLQKKQYLSDPYQYGRDSLKDIFNGLFELKENDLIEKARDCFGLTTVINLYNETITTVETFLNKWRIVYLTWLSKQTPVSYDERQFMDMTDTTLNYQNLINEYNVFLSDIK